MQLPVVPIHVFGVSMIGLQVPGGHAADVAGSDFVFLGQPGFDVFDYSLGHELGFALSSPYAQAGGVDAGIEFTSIVLFGVTLSFDDMIHISFTRN